MDQAQAIEDAKRILGDQVVALLAAGDYTVAAARAQVEGGYDSWLLAAELADLLGIRAQAGVLLEVSAEGATFKRSPADYFGMAAALRAKSTTASQPAGIGVVSIDTGGDFAPRFAGGEGYWTWDGDVPVWYPWITPDVP